MMSCDICCCDVGDGGFVACPYCSFEACHECVGTYLTSYPREPSCMSCRKPWKREFVMERLPGRWVRAAFLPHIGSIIMDREKALIPDAQHEASLIAKVKEISRQIQALPTNAKIQRKFPKSASDARDAALEEKNATLHTLIAAQRALKMQTVTYAGAGQPSTTTKDKKKKNYVLKCPYDECRGYVAAEDYACGTCGRRTCSRCNACMHDLHACDHACNPDDVESAAMIARETRPCPNCTTPIYKISGCDQMFCTQCQTSFSWSSGEIVTGILHNPHYYEWLAATAASGALAINLENVACGEIPDDPMLYARYLQHLNVDRAYAKKLLDVHRIAQHVREVSIPSYRVDRVKDNFDLRVQFLLREFDEGTWATKLANREKKRMKTQAIHEMLQLTQTILQDFIRQTMHAPQRTAETLREFDQFKAFYEESIYKLTTVHGGAVPKDLDLFHG